MNHKSDDSQVITNLNTDISSPKERGVRIKRIRNMANLSREEMCADGNINIHTLVGWETGRFGGLTRTGANRIVNRVAVEGIICSIEWLMDQTGDSPKIINIPSNQISHESKDSSSSDNANEILLIENELALFLKQSNSISYLIEDNSMAPQFFIGDYVAGINRYPEKIASVIGFDCIVRLENGKTILRNLRKGPSEGTYNLVCNNPSASSDAAILYDVKLASAAPVIWHRKKDP